MSKIITDTWYEARDTTGSGRLTGSWETLKDAKKGVDASNNRIEKKGFEPRQYLITKTVSEVEYTNAGKFMRRSLKETAVQMYPKERR